MFGRGIFGLALFLFFALSSFATTTVTGQLQNLGTGTVGQGAFVRFWLRGCGGNIPRVNGTAIIAPSQGGVYFFDMPANSSGVISGTLYSTRDSTGLLGGDIECGGSKLSVWYGLQVFVGGKGGSESPVHAKNTATLDISNVTPITTNPVVTAPTGDSTYLRKDGGNSPLTGPVSSTSMISDAGGTHTGTETYTGPVVTPAIGPSAAQQHTIPVVTSDVFGLLAAVQTFTNKTLTSPTINSGALNGTFTGPTTLTGVTNLNGTSYFGSGSPWIDVKSSLYGAVGNGSTNDATAINNASTAATNAGVGASNIVYFPTGNFDVTAQIVDKQGVVFRGEDKGSAILADATFPTSTPLVQVGNVALNDVTRLEHVTVDCNSVTGCTGITTTTGQEMSGADYVTVRRTNVFGVDVETGSQNSIWSNMQIGSSTTPPAAWEGFRLNTNAAVKTTIFNATLLPTGAGSTACIHDVLGVLLAYAIHCENVTDGIRFDSGAFGAVHGITGASNITNTIKLNAGTGAFFASEIERNGGTNSVNDVDCGVTLSVDNAIAFYAHSHSGSKCSWLDSTGFNATTYKTVTNCSSSGGTCASAPAGAVTIAAAATTVTVSTTAVTANSDISLTRNDALGTRLGVTCNTATAAGDIKISTITAGTSFVITVQNAPATNPLCLTYSIVN